MEKITHVLFDLGGVVVRLRGKPVKSEWFPDSAVPGDIWRKWLGSKAPREFESGKIDPRTFANRVVSELHLQVEPAEFLDYFRTLPEGPYPDALKSIDDMRDGCVKACFSNSNVLHWDRKMQNMGLESVFEHTFASHLMGMVKPDVEAFQYVLSALNVPATQILFFDDNQLNVDAARSIGMQADKIEGPDELRSAMIGHSLLQP